ncbi:MAG: hypothetical protein HKN50_05415 [Gammaproteobacteria bacterium]|nr:hypothetical protein [Gammaproteobacteria bacterium]
MNPENLLSVAIVVFVLMLVGIALTIVEFRRGEPHDQLEDKSKLRDSPHSNVD